MSNTFGSFFRVTTFGESHGPMIGAVIDGIESNLPLDVGRIQKELDRRRPAQNEFESQRKEHDRIEIVSGVFEGRTTGTPVAILIRNTDQHSKDYENLKDVYRPGHADETYEARYGVRDYRGGGRASGRETAARVAAGAVAKQVLESKGIAIESRIISIHGRKENFDEFLEEAKRKGESVGGVLECTVKGMPKGIGEPVFDKLDAYIAHAVMSIGAIKGIEFGSGFSSELLYGSENNLPCNAGGILGGISDGNDIGFRVAVKPTPSIAKPQPMKTRDGGIREVGIEGRHDVCICLRIGPVVEAMTAIAVLDQLYARTGR
mgnify:FL=1